MNWITVFIFVFFVNYHHAIADCPSRTKCISIKACPKNLQGEFVYPCNSGRGICCKIQEDLTVPRINPDSKTIAHPNNEDLYPTECGVADTDDRIANGKNASIGQFPWMVLLGYTQPETNFLQFFCGGTLLNKRFVLTAAHCINLSGVQLTAVRLGELNLDTTIDCERKKNITKCADPIVDISIEKQIVHPGFNTSLKNDIALLKLNSDVTYSDFIAPICLPFNIKLSDLSFRNKKLYITGWGKTDAESLGGSSILQFALLVTWNDTACNAAIPPNLRPISDTQICAVGNTGEDSCKGDSGGPLSYFFEDANSTSRIYQVGVVSLGSASPCGISNLPSIYTRVNKYLSWIVDNMN